MSQPRRAGTGPRNGPHKPALPVTIDRPNNASPLRVALCELRPNDTTHAGLWLDRFLATEDKMLKGDEAKGARKEHIRQLLSTLKVPVPYQKHARRWQAHFEQLCGQEQAVSAIAEVQGRMAVGLGATSVLEVSICLHHTYGVPIIPGSALKGLASNFARRRLSDEEWGPEGASFKALFGDLTQAACVAFHDALWIPSEKDGKIPLELDVMTVHHPAYYTTRSSPPAPADTDAPTPISFVTAHGRYLIALEGPPLWADAGLAILKLALLEEGIGAKTAAGYGRLVLDYTSASERAEKEAEALNAASEEKAQKVEELFDGLEVNTAQERLPQIFALVPQSDRPATIQRCIDQFSRKRVRKAQKNNKPWVAALTHAQESIKHNASKGSPS